MTGFRAEFSRASLILVDLHLLDSFQLRMAVYSSSLVSADSSPASTITTPLDCSFLIPTIPSVCGARGTFAESSTRPVQIRVTITNMIASIQRSWSTYLYHSFAANTIAMSFSLTGGSVAEGSKVSQDCITDWITIPCATNTNSPTAQSGTPTVCVDRICGMVFNSVTTNAGTNSVPVNSK